MKILVLGSGGREHAIVSTLLKDDGVEVWCAPGNAGIAREVVTMSVDITDCSAVVELANKLQVDLVVIGPEGPLVAGVSDALRELGFAVFGPSAAAAQIEGSKTFAKQVMFEAGVPTARARVCTSIGEVESALHEFGAPYVVKDDGLAAGKGVVVTSELDEATEHARMCLSSSASAAVVVEEFLDGPEVSLFAVTDGKTVIPLSPAQDFKRINDGDKGPNTGGMGAYSPLPWAPADIVDQALHTVLQPTVNQLSKQGTPFSGLLYAGLCLTSAGIRVIEFNARFGDPETQVVLSRLQSSLSKLLFQAAVGSLDTVPALKWADESAVTVVMAAGNYPGNPEIGATITGLDKVAGATVFHSGTAIDDQGNLKVSGGRVLCVTALGADLTQARRSAYQAVDVIDFEGEQYRSDIALRASQGEILIP